MTKKPPLHFQSGQTSILDDPRPIREAVKDTARYHITSIISRGLQYMDQIRTRDQLKQRFLEDARLHHPAYVAWRYGLLPGQARQLIHELENLPA